MIVRKPIGKLDFVLRILLLSALSTGAEYLFPGRGYLRFDHVLRYLYDGFGIVAFGVLGIYVLETIGGRFQDAGISHRCQFPIFAFWIIATAILWTRSWPIGVALLVLLLVFGWVASDGRLRARSSSERRIEERRPATLAETKFPAQLLVGQVGFLRALVTICCLCLPLVWLANSSGLGSGLWIARLGLVALGIVWFIKLVGRLEDAGRMPRFHRSFFLVACFLLMKLLPRFRPAGGTREHLAFPRLTSGFLGSLLPWFARLDTYEKLALFFLIQLPLALLPTMRRPLASEANSAKVNQRESAPAKKSIELALSGPLEYCRIIIVIGVLFTPLIYMDGVSGGGIGSWIARVGYCVLTIFWIAFANGRLEDAGWAHSWYPSQYCLVVLIVSFMPLAVHWINRYEAVALFVLVQTPTAFLRSRPRSEGTLPDRPTMTISTL